MPMPTFGGNILEYEPKRFLPHDSILVFRRDRDRIAKQFDALDFIQVAAVQADRAARWSFMILFKEFEQVEIVIGGSHFDWLAFVEVPDLFAALGARTRQLDEAIREASSGRWKLLEEFDENQLKKIVDLLISVGAVLQLE